MNIYIFFSLSITHSSPFTFYNVRSTFYCYSSSMSVLYAYHIFNLCLLHSMEYYVECTRTSSTSTHARAAAACWSHGWSMKAGSKEKLDSIHHHPTSFLIVKDIFSRIYTIKDLISGSHTSLLYLFLTIGAIKQQQQQQHEYLWGRTK